MNQKGFSLIELLAVIAILGVIALITYPIIGEVLESTEKKTFKSSVEELINITEMDYSEYARNGSANYVYNGNNITCDICTNDIKYNGEIEDGKGSIVISNGKTITVSIESKYYRATLNDKGKIEVNKKE